MLLSGIVASKEWPAEVSSFLVRNIEHAEHVDHQKDSKPSFYAPTKLATTKWW